MEHTEGSPLALGAAAIGTSYSFLVPPLMSLGGLGVILLLCRWTFSTSSRDKRAARTAAVVASRSGDFGLLVPVATVRTRDDAEMLRTVLAAGGIRCTLAADPDGVDVLVFRQDALQARELVSS